MAALGLSIDGRLEEGETLRAWGLGTGIDSWSFQALVNGSWVNVGTAGVNTYVIPAGAAGTAYRLMATSEGVTSYSPVTGAAIVDTKKINAPYLNGPAGQVIGTEDPGARSVFSWLTFSDPDRANYGGGSLLLQDSTSLLYGGEGDDMLSVRFEGTGAGQFSYNAATREVRYAFNNGNPVAIGTIDAALNGNGTDLKIAFNSNATVAVVDALINNLQFSNADDSPTFSRLLTLRVTDPTGASAQRVTAAYIDNTADAPVFTSATSFAVNENQTAVGTIAALDPDKEAGQPQGIVYSLVPGEGSVNNGSFQIDAATGALSFRAAPDFESPYLWPEYSVRVRATDSEGSISEQAVVVIVRNVNEAPVASYLQVQAQEEGPPITFDAVFTDPDAGDSHTITFNTWGTVGNVTLNGRTFTYDPAGRFDYVPGPDHVDPFPGFDSFTYTVTDAAGLSSTQTVSLRIQGENDAASISGPATASVQEDTGLNFTESLVASGQLVVNDPDLYEDSVRAPLTGSTGPGYFYVYPSGLWSWYVGNSQVQYLGAGETAVASLGVTSYDGTATQELRVTITGVNDTPHLAHAPGSNLGDVTEAGASGAGVAQAAGRIHAMDRDASDTLAFSGSANGVYGSFAIDSTTGQWTYALDNSFPWTQSLAQGQTVVETFTATARDLSGASVQQQVTITVHGANDAPVIASSSELVGLVQEPTVGTGMLTLDIAAQYDRDSSIVDSAGRIVVLGQGQGPSGFSAPVIARLNPDGSPDASFGDGGQVAVTPYFKPASIAVDAGGRYLVAGYTSENYMYSQLDWAVERRHPDGSLDTSFGNGGKVSFDFGGYDSAQSVHFDSAGILVSGYVPDAQTGFSEQVILRLDSNGAPVIGFGDFGRLMCGINGGSMTVDALGHIVVWGFAEDAQTGQPQFHIARYLPDGSADTSFGDAGVVTINPGAARPVGQLAVGSNGQILLGGIEFTGDWNYTPVSLALLRPDGSLETGFGNEGWAHTGLSAETLELAFDAQGRPLVGFSSPVSADFHLARLTLDGALDPSFHLGGTTHADLGGEETVEDIHVLSTGDVLVVGTNWQGSNLETAFASFDEQGNLNTAFGETPPAGALVASGTLYVVGNGWDNGDTAQWTGSATGVYGEFQLTAQGSWTYVLDVNDPDTQALEDGTTGTEHFIATVKDSFGASASCEVVVTVVGSYDPPSP